jgi:hypothetical protein
MLYKIAPEWTFWSDFVRNIFQAMLKLDEGANTHPIEATVNSPSEIKAVFDAISYGKVRANLANFREFQSVDILSLSFVQGRFCSPHGGELPRRQAVARVGALSPSSSVWLCNDRRSVGRLQ